MRPVITFFFIIISAMYLYGYYTYYLKDRKKLPKCDVIYILSDDLKDDHRPDFSESQRRSKRQIKQKTKVRENVKRRLLEIIRNKTGEIISENTEFVKIKELAYNYNITDQDINRIFHEESLKIRGNM